MGGANVIVALHEAVVSVSVYASVESIEIRRLNAPPHGSTGRRYARSLSDGPRTTSFMDLLGYVRVSTDKQRLDRQVAQINRAAKARKGWTIVDIVHDPARSAANLDRPFLLQTLVRLERGEADVLVVSDLDRLSRSVVDMGDLLAWFEDAGVRLIALAQNLDTGLPGVGSMALAWASWAQLDREMGSEATRSGLQERRAAGACIGRPAVADRPEVVERIVRMRDHDEMSLPGICAALNAEGVPTLRGAAAWRPSALQTILGYKRPPRRRQRDVLPPITPRSHRSPRPVIHPLSEPTRVAVGP